MVGESYRHLAGRCFFGGVDDEFAETKAVQRRRSYGVPLQDDPFCRIRVLAVPRIEPFVNKGSGISVGESSGQLNVWTVPKTLDNSGVTEAGAFTNYRLCKDTLKPVAVVPFPKPSSVWAPPSLCGTQASSAP